jgi:hypothetical protein
MAPDTLTGGVWEAVEWHLSGHSNAADIVGGSGENVIRLFSDLFDTCGSSTLANAVPSYRYCRWKWSGCYQVVWWLLILVGTVTLWQIAERNASCSKI